MCDQIAAPQAASQIGAGRTRVEPVGDGDAVDVGRVVGQDHPSIVLIFVKKVLTHLPVLRPADKRCWLNPGAVRRRGP